MNKFLFKFWKNIFLVLVWFNDRCRKENRQKVVVFLSFKIELSVFEINSCWVKTYLNSCLVFCISSLVQLNQLRVCVCVYAQRVVFTNINIYSLWQKIKKVLLIVNLLTEISIEIYPYIKHFGVKIISTRKQNKIRHSCFLLVPLLSWNTFQMKMFKKKQKKLLCYIKKRKKNETNKNTIVCSCK